MEKTIRIIVKINPITAPKIIRAIEELTRLGVYNHATSTIIYDDSNKELEQQIISILDNASIKY
ncbi:hypothetical protein [Alistipes sp.]|uniref:hypothetical protein n=1 Tax=Alistipes sp. TaxID=1872444 RepID=UPI0023F1D140|nr:hypothetical protein [Alistipes sp.]